MLEAILMFFVAIVLIATGLIEEVSEMWPWLDYICPGMGALMALGTIVNLVSWIVDKLKTRQRRR